MRKITVRDIFKEFHTYEGDGLKFFINEGAIDVWDGQNKIGHHPAGQYVWVKDRANEAKDAGPPIPQGTTGPDKVMQFGGIAIKENKDLDPFTLAAMKAAEGGGIPPAKEMTATEVLERQKEWGENLQKGINGIINDDKEPHPGITDDPAAIQKQYDKLAAAEAPKKKRIRNRKTVRETMASATVPRQTKPCMTCGGHESIPDPNDPLEKQKCPDC